MERALYATSRAGTRSREQKADGLDTEPRVQGDAAAEGAKNPQGPGSRPHKSHSGPGPCNFPL